MSNESLSRFNPFSIKRRYQKAETREGRKGRQPLCGQNHILMDHRLPSAGEQAMVRLAVRVCVS